VDRGDPILSSVFTCRSQSRDGYCLSRRLHWIARCADARLLLDAQEVREKLNQRERSWLAIRKRSRFSPGRRRSAATLLLAVGTRKLNRPIVAVDQRGLPMKRSHSRHGRPRRSIRLHFTDRARSRARQSAALHYYAHTCENIGTHERLMKGSDRLDPHKRVQ